MIPIHIHSQPDDVTCGPTSLHAIYQYYNDNIPLTQVIQEVAYLEEGGTLAALLGCHALQRGYSAELYSYNLQIFDPSWFRDPAISLEDKLQQQIAIKTKRKLLSANRAYLNFLKAGGTIKHDNLTPHLLRRYFQKKIPVLAGLSATYLYQCQREYTTADNHLIRDDIKGEPTGHFVVLCGYDDEKNHIIVADPL